MKIRIKVFASLKDYFEPEFEMDVSSGVTVADAMNMITTTNSLALPVLAKCRVAVNENFVQSDYNLSENEALFIIPPSSGG